MDVVPFQYDLHFLYAKLFARRDGNFTDLRPDYVLLNLISVLRGPHDVVSVIKSRVAECQMRLLLRGGGK